MVLARAGRERLVLIARYCGVSVISILVTDVLILTSFGLFHVGSALFCTTGSSLLAAAAPYALNRRWVWGLSGRSRFAQELMPFSAMVVIGVVLSAVVVGVVALVARADIADHALQTLVIVGGSLGSYALVWIARFVVLDRFVFGLGA